MTTLVISDLHLEENRPDITDLFINFMKNAEKSAHALYILGDFFESWIGDDDDSSFHRLIISTLKHATDQGLPVYMMHGNRDFLLGKRFLRQSGCKLLPEEYVINLYGTRTLMMHGDTLCREDHKYLKFRKKARSWFWQKLMLLKSLDSRRTLAKRYREGSKKHTSTTPYHIMDVTQDEVERLMLTHQVNHLIHGHTHRQAIHQFHLQGSPATRTVLGAWHEHGNVLICEPDGENKLVDIKK